MNAINSQTQKSPQLTPKFRSLVSAQMCLELFPALAANDSSSIWRSLFRSPNRPSVHPSLHAPRRHRSMDSSCRTINFLRLRNRISEILASRFHMFIGPPGGRDSSTIRNSEIFSFHPNGENRNCVSALNLKHIS